MKKVFSILETGKRKAGAAILCSAITLSLSTGMAFAANADIARKSDQDTQSTITTSIPTEKQAKLERIRKEAEARDYSEYAALGMTYDMERDLLLYDGKVVRYFYDEVTGRGFTSNNYNSLDYVDYDKSVDLMAIRDANGKLTGLSPTSKEEFDNLTARIEQSHKQLEQNKKQDATAGSVSKRVQPGQ